MNQIKYLVYASLILIILLIGYFLFSLLPLANQSEVNKTVNSEKATTFPPVSEAASRGKELFHQNCQACHSLDKKLTGPALRGVTERGPWTDRANLYKWIRNPAAFIPTTAYTKALQNDYKQIMPSFPQLSEKDIDYILEFLSATVSSTTVAME